MKKLFLLFTLLLTVVAVRGQNTLPLSGEYAGVLSIDESYFVLVCLNITKDECRVKIRPLEEDEFIYYDKEPEIISDHSHNTFTLEFGLVEEDGMTLQGTEYCSYNVFGEFQLMPDNVNDSNLIKAQFHSYTLYYDKYKNVVASRYDEYYSYKNIFFIKVNSYTPWYTNHASESPVATKPERRLPRGVD